MDAIVMRFIMLLPKLAMLLFKFCSFTGLIYVIPIFFIIFQLTRFNMLFEILLYPFMFITVLFVPFRTLENICRIVTKNPEFRLIKNWSKVGDYLKNFITLLQTKGIKGVFSKEVVKNIKTNAPDVVEYKNGFYFGNIKFKKVLKDVNADGHILIIGGAGSGKTTSCVIPTLKTWNSSIFAIDIKGDLSKQATYLNRTSKVFDIKEPNFTYNPFDVVKNSDNTSNSLKNLVYSLIPLSADVKDPFWINNARTLLNGLILHLYKLGANFTETMQIILSRNISDLIQEIIDSDDTESQMYLNRFVGMDLKTLSGISAEMLSQIEIFGTDTYLKEVLKPSDNSISIEDLENNTDIFIKLSESDLKIYKNFVSLIINQFLECFEKRIENNNKPILMLIDEFPRLSKLDNISNALATLRSKKITIALVVQSKSQLNALYGKDTAEVITDNCSYKAILKATEPNTQEWCSKLVGTFEKEKKSKNISNKSFDIDTSSGISTTTEEKRIIKPEEFGYLKDIVLFTPDTFLRVEKKPYYEDKSF